MKLILSCLALLSIASLSHADGYCINGQCYGRTYAQPTYQTQYYGAWGGYGNGAPSYYPQTYWTAPRQPTYYQAPIYSGYSYSGYYTQPSYYGGYGYGASYYNGGCVGGQCFR